ncbi:EpsG family protein [Enterococcus sp. CWB-B31]|uniref:EpsG family protein n=1 Tax=Enterococcus sp. CWB-B31 TaxID=2885159 RepID=UPI001E31CC6B|nr:EpsG family protein [Enterococcus sp. CWB-B31]MCB5954625.1 EpsG family protein [Enterococcus sp. CWB-B31]
MGIYVITNIVIVVLGLFCGLSQHKDKLLSYIFIIPSFIMLFIISAYRGDFATDYRGYESLFYTYNQFGFIEVLRGDLYQEKGYIFLSRMVGEFTDNPIYLFIVVSFIILFIFYHQFQKYSTYMWLSVLMFVTIGPFYTSFNIMRQILAVAIIFSGSRFLYERKMIKYFLIVFLASLFHRTSLIMIVAYFILNFKLSIKNIIVLFFTSVVAMLYLDRVVLIIQNFFYSGYTENSYGMTGLSFTNVVVPITILVFCLFHYKKIDLNNTIHRVWINAVFFYVFFSIAGLQIQMVQRLSEFFRPFVMLSVPFLLSKIANKEIKIITIVGLVFVLVLYNYIMLSGSGYDPYYFIWD